MECVVDTNVLVYAAIEDASLHESVRRKLEQMEGIYFPLTVIEELVIVLKKLGVQESFIRRYVRAVLSDERTRVINMRKEEVMKAIDLLEMEKASVRNFNDKLILIGAKKTNLPLYTFDKELRRECKKLRVKLMS